MEDLDTSNHNQCVLANCIHESWDRADERKEKFAALDFQRIVLPFWSRVREVEYTMGGGGENKKEKNNDNNENNELKKKINIRGKKEKPGEQTGTVAAAVVKPGAAPPKPALTPTPKGYCFRCGEDGNSAKTYSYTRDLECSLHSGSVSNILKACTNWRRQNNLGVHPAIVKYEANQVVVEAPEDIFGLSPDDSTKIISDLQVTDSPNNGGRSLNGCHVTIALGSLSYDSDNYSLDQKRFLLLSKSYPCFLGVLPGLGSIIFSG